MSENNKFKYEVYNPHEDRFLTPKFETYKEALEKQILWNKTFPGILQEK